MANKIFRFAPAADQPEVERSFDLNDQHFVCVPEIDGLTLLSVVTGFDPDNPVSNGDVITKFLRTIIDDPRDPKDPTKYLNEDNYKRFEATVKARRSGVGLEQLTDLMGAMMEEYLGDFHSQPDSGSASG